MGKTSTTTAIWGMLAERWHKAIKAKALSAYTERGYLYTARRWAEWIDEQGRHHRRDLVIPVWPPPSKGRV